MFGMCVPLQFLDIGVQQRLGQLNDALCLGDPTPILVNNAKVVAGQAAKQGMQRCF